MDTSAQQGSSRPAEAAGQLAEALRDRVTHTAALAGAEADLAARSIPAIVVLILLAGALAMTAWLVFVAGAAWFAVQLGAPLFATAGVLTAVHALLAVYALRRADRLSRNLSLPRLRASLSGMRTAAPT